MNDIENCLNEILTAGLNMIMTQTIDQTSKRKQ